jgi:hypothetical protein
MPATSQLFYCSCNSSNISFPTSHSQNTVFCLSRIPSLDNKWNILNDETPQKEWTISQNNESPQLDLEHNGRKAGEKVDSYARMARPLDRFLCHESKHLQGCQKVSTPGHLVWYLIVGGVMHALRSLWKRALLDQNSEVIN